ncbi:MAG: putative molybdenum carrier protein [Desulfobacterales bacterium]|nr:putative molybdenum carrier protein [Desulfobacterales bacterium]
MLTQIVSGGQTGADQAALDVAIKLNIPHGGWIAKGRKTESGPLPEIYKLREMTVSDYPSRTRQNIIDSQGTIIISRGPLRGGSKLTQSFARVKGKPNCHIDLLKQDTFEAAIILQAFIKENLIQVLNVAGPRASHDPGIYFEVKSILEAMLYLMYLDSDAETELADLVPEPAGERPSCRTLDEAVKIIINSLSLKHRARVARMGNDRLKDLYFAWMDSVKIMTGLDSDSSGLMDALRRNRTTVNAYTPEDGAMDIIRGVKEHLTDHYRLRIL